MSNAPKVSPLAQTNNNGYSAAPQSPVTNANISNVASPPPPPPPPPMGQMAMGMPFQVLPSLPVKQQQKLSPTQTNGNVRKSPQTFESNAPPPMGCRPQIKIPENPMATLRKVPRPQPKDTYWVEECINESPRHSETEDTIRQQIAASPIFQQQQQRHEYVPSPTLQASPAVKPATPVNVPSTPLYAQSPIPERQEINIPIRNVKLEDVRSPSPTRVYINQSPQHQTTSSPITVARNMEPIQPQQTKLQQQILNNQPQGGRIILSTMPSRTIQATQPNVSTDLIELGENKLINFYAIQLSSLYIPPPMNLDDKQYLLSQQSPSWMSSKQNTDTPEWVNRDEIDNFIQQTKLMHAQAQAPNEHVIPISMEKSPNLNFGPAPFYATPQHLINSVIQPRIGKKISLVVVKFIEFLFAQILMPINL